MRVWDALDQNYQHDAPVRVWDALDQNYQHDAPVKMWISFRAALTEADEILPELPRKLEENWVTDELQKLSRKERDAWLLLSTDGRNGSDDALKLLYQRLCKLSKAAAVKVRNAWWSAREVEAVKHAWGSEQSGLLYRSSGSFCH